MMGWFDDIGSALSGIFSGGGGDGGSLASFAEPAATGVSSNLQAPGDYSGLAGIAGDVGAGLAADAPAAIQGANAAAFADQGATSGTPSFSPQGQPPGIGNARDAANAGIQQATNQAQVGGVTPTMTQAPTAPPTPPSATVPGTEASRTPGAWYTTMAKNAGQSVVNNPWTTLGVGLGLGGNLAAMGQRQPSSQNTNVPNPFPAPGAAPAMPVPPPLSTATGASPLLRGAGGMQVQNPWSGLQRPGR